MRRAAWKTLGTRLLHAIAVLLGVVCLSFALLRVLPVDPIAGLAPQPGMSAEDLAALRIATGLDQPLWLQFADYLGGLLRGDWGSSRSTGAPVLQVIVERLPASIELALLGFIPAVLLTLGLGLSAALNPDGWLDRFARVVASLGVALPVFVTGLLLIQIFYVEANWAVEPTGRLDPFLVAPAHVTGSLLIDALLARDPEVLRSAFAHITLPAAAMAFFALGPLLRVFRASMLAAMAGPGVQGARMLGLSPSVILTRYALPEALGPLISVGILTFGYMLGANVLVEKVFAWPGIGRLALEAMAVQDFNAVQGVMLALAVVVVSLSLVADALALWLDPRMLRA